MSFSIENQVDMTTPTTDQFVDFTSIGSEGASNLGTVTSTSLGNSMSSDFEIYSSSYDYDHRGYRMPSTRSSQMYSTPLNQVPYNIK